MSTPNGSSDEEEDEETLQLQLKAIEARLKLKKLQKAKLKSSAASGAENTRDDQPPEEKVQVAHSPRPQRQAAQAPASPSRILLGIDKGLRASDVSLKRARGAGSNLDAVVNGGARHQQRPAKSFNERLRDSRVEDRQRKEKEDHAKQARSTGFGIKKALEEASRENARDLIRTEAPLLQPLRSGPGGDVADPTDLGRNGKRRIDDQPPRISDHDSRPEAHSDEALVERYSGFQLSKRLMDETTVELGLAGKTVVSIPQLLKDITSPNYDIPDFPTEDFVVVGIVASKSSPKDRATTHNTNSSGDPDSSAKAKFMAITLTDLQWSLDLFLFDTGFSRFWKLTVGTVIAILNPGVMPPKPHLRDTGRFSLKLSSSEDTVLELGMAQDLGFCKSLKKDGKECGQWIDKRKTEFCDFHVNLAIEKTTAGRMEINGMTGMGLFGLGGDLGSSKRGGRGGGIGGGGSRWRGSSKSSKTAPTGPNRPGHYHDRTLNETGYLIPPEYSTTRSTAALLDSSDYVQGALSAKERSRKRLAEHEKERELSRKLAASGNGMGLEYLRVKGRAGDGDKGGTGESGRRDEEREGKLDAGGLGLVGSSAADVKLSPVRVEGKRRREEVGAQPMGWGGAFKRDLPTRKERRAADGVDVGVGKVVETVAEADALRRVGGSAVVRVTPATNTAAADDDDDDDDLDII